jgi:hypothetical protein
MSAENTTPNKQPGKKASAAVIGERVSMCMKLLLLNRNRADILAYAEKQGWNASPRSIDTYIQKAKAAILTEATLDRTAEFGLAKERLLDLYTRARSSADLTNERLALAEMNKLMSNYLPPAVQTLELRGNDAHLFAQLLDALKGKNLSAGDLFAALITELANAEVGEGESSHE